MKAPTLTLSRLSNARGETMPNRKKSQREKKSGLNWFAGFFNSQNDAAATASYCTPDQCFINNPQSFSSSNIIAPNIPTDTKVNNSTQAKDVTESTTLADLIPPELSQLIANATKQGLSSSMLITLANEGVTDYLKSLHYHPETIYWINQSVRALLLVSLGTSAITALVGSFSSLLLSEYCGVSKETSNYITTGVTLGINVLTMNPLSIIDTTVAIGTSVGASLVGSKVTKSGYDYARDAFFADKENEDVAANPIPKRLKR
jgi:hypothetical protein